MNQNNTTHKNFDQTYYHVHTDGNSQHIRTGGGTNHKEINYNKCCCCGYNSHMHCQYGVKHEQEKHFMNKPHYIHDNCQ